MRFALFTIWPGNGNLCSNSEFGTLKKYVRKLFNLHYSLFTNYFWTFMELWNNWILGWNIWGFFLGICGYKKERGSERQMTLSKSIIIFELIIFELIIFGYPPKQQIGCRPILKVMISTIWAEVESSSTVTLQFQFSKE